MALTNLPGELLDMIVEYSMPESFENLAVACKRIHARCLPFVKRHNELCSHFRDFAYDAQPRDTVVAASDLIDLIANEPTVARYIRNADLVDDSRYLRHSCARGNPPKSVPPIEEGGVIVQLFANSRYLQQAQLDWREYYLTFAEDVRDMRYSQHGSVFLLTLLEDTEKIILPSQWKMNAATEQLLDELVDEGRNSNFQSSGLRSITNFDGHLSASSTDNGLSWARAFLTQPNLQSFRCGRTFAIGTNPRSLAFNGSPYIADRLEVARLLGCCIDHVGITDFLKHTPRLKTLKYSHSANHDTHPPNWDICEFINAVAREAGSHLIQCSIVIISLRGSILPGKVSVRNFQKLKQFEFPLEVVMCNANAANVIENITNSLHRFLGGSQDQFVADLIPSSVSHLMLNSKAMMPHDIALDSLFNRFRAIRKTQLPHLEKIFLSCKQESDKVYKQLCNKLVADGEKEGVYVYLFVSYAEFLEWAE